MNFFVDASVCLLTICWSFFPVLFPPGRALLFVRLLLSLNSRFKLNYLRFGQTHQRIERDIYLLPEPANKLTICSATHSNLALQKANDRMHIEKVYKNWRHKSMRSNSTGTFCFPSSRSSSGNLFESGLHVFCSRLSPLALHSIEIIEIVTICSTNADNETAQQNRTRHFSLLCFCECVRHSSPSERADTSRSAFAFSVCLHQQRPQMQIDSKQNNFGRKFRND